MRTAAASVRQLGYDTRSTSTAGRAFERSMLGAQGVMNTVTNAAVGLGKGVAVLGGIGIATGFQFNAGMERAQIGMKTLVGSGKEARGIVEDVTEFARKSPLFGIEEMLQAAQQLIGVGFDAKKIVPTLTTFSDTLAAMGRKPEDLMRMRYAFSQMASKGKVSAEELRGQLGEIFPAMKMLAKGMGISVDELNDKMKEGGVKSAKAIPILMDQMNKKFGGATDKMYYTWTGQWRAMVENTRYALGGITRQTQTWLTTDIMPELNRFISAVGDTWNNQNMTAQQKMNRTRQLARQILGPLGLEIKRKIQQANIGGAIVRGFNYALPRLANAAGRGAGTAAREFIKGWWASDVYGKIFVASAILAKMGVFGWVGGKAGNKFIDAASGRIRKSGAWGQAGKVAGRAVGLGMVAGAIAGMAGLGAAVAEALRKVRTDVIQPWIEDQFGTGGSILNDITNKLGEAAGSFNPIIDQAFKNKRATGGVVAGPGPTLVGERGPEILNLPTGARVGPTNSISYNDTTIAGIGNITIPVMLRGREIARAVYDDAASQKARR